MYIIKTVLTSLFLSLLLLAPYVTHALATETESCSDVIKECFAYTAAERDDCFKGVVSKPSCSDSEVSILAKRRAEFSTLVPSGVDSGPSFLGPQLIDRTCIANFDNAWSGALLHGVPSIETYITLRAALERCARAPASDMLTP